MHCVISEMRMLPCPRGSAALCALVFLAVLFSTSCAGRHCSFSTDRQDALRQQTAASEAAQKEALLPLVQARMLEVKTNDYSSYNPAPAMEKPHSKLIPN